MNWKALPSFYPYNVAFASFFRGLGRSESVATPPLQKAGIELLKKVQSFELFIPQDCSRATSKSTEKFSSIFTFIM